MFDHAYTVIRTLKEGLCILFFIIYLSILLSLPEVRPVGLDLRNLQQVRTTDRSLAPIPISSETKQHSAIILADHSYWWQSCKTGKQYHPVAALYVDRTHKECCLGCYTIKHWVQHPLPLFFFFKGLYLECISCLKIAAIHERGWERWDAWGR